MQLNRLAKYAWGTLAFTILVILWGAFVRATGSGAGCGNHWPICNGTVIPRAPQIETVIEFTHRLTSGTGFLLVLGLLIWVFRRYSKGAQIRTTAVLAMAFMISEALVGAGLVLFGWVAEDTSPERAIVVGVHLLNTFLLTAFITWTAWLASGGGLITLKDRKPLTIMIGIGLVFVLLLSMAGAMTALGDTLFPSETLSEGVRADIDPASHFLVRLRLYHPVIAFVTGFYLLFLGRRMMASFDDERVKKWALTLIGIYVVQLLAGMINVVLLAPIWMQIIHLLLACASWIALIMLALSALNEDAVLAVPIMVPAAGD